MRLLIATRSSGTWGKAVILPRCAEFDAVVIGGGPSGLAAAITLTKADRRVLVLDQAAKTNFHWGESLSPAANPLLHELGITTESMAANHLRSSGIQSAWGDGVLRDSPSLRNPRGHGWLLDRAAFDSKLRSIGVESGAQFQNNASGLQFQREPHTCWNLIAKDCGYSMRRVTWIVDCTGRQSWFASRLGVKRIRFGRQIAFGGIFCNHGSATDQDAATLIEAVPDGWWYTSRVPNGRRVTVYLTHPDSDTVQRARTKSGFYGLLSATKHVLPRIERANYVLDHNPVATLANSSRLEVFSGEGWTSAGDAATAFDPLSSQGIFHALYSGVASARAVSASMSGDSLALSEYTRRLNAIFSEYLRNRNLFYCIEQRWLGSHFWQTAVGVCPSLAHQCGSALAIRTGV